MNEPEIRRIRRRSSQEVRVGVAAGESEYVDRLWSVQDLACYLGLTIKGTYGLAERRAIPSLKVGGRLRFDPAAIRAWVRDRQQPR